MNRYSGILYALGAFGLWGLLPVYWKALHEMPATEILAHRVVWSVMILMVVVWVSGKVRSIWAALTSPRTLGAVILSSLLLGVNWVIYLWAVNAGYLLESSLGYFINPLLSVLLGFAFLGERLRRIQVLSILVAACGVIYLTLFYGRVPWIALSLAGSFGLYGLVRKQMKELGSMESLFLELVFLLTPALWYLWHREVEGTGVFLHADWNFQLLVIAAGPLTVLPLILFGIALKRLSLSTVGVMQYLTPSLQFLLAVFVYGEKFSGAHLITLSLIWAGLLLYTVEGFFELKKRMKPLIAASSPSSRKFLKASNL